MFSPSSRRPRKKGARIVGEGGQRSSVRPYRQAGEGPGRWGLQSKRGCYSYMAKECFWLCFFFPFEQASS